MTVSGPIPHSGVEQGDVAQRDQGSRAQPAFDGFAREHDRRPGGAALDLGADYSDGTAVVWGVLWVDAASVTAQAPGVEPVELVTYEVPGWDHAVVAGAFPDDHFRGALDVVVVAHD